VLYRVPNWGLALLAGAIFPLGLAPFDVWPLVPLSAGLLCTALNRTQRAGSVGFAYGAGFFGAGVSWVYVSIHFYGNTPVWLALGLTTLFCGGLALLFAAQAIAYRRLASRHAAWRAVQFASLWVLFEWFRSWLLTGFPWLYAGYGALDSPFAGWIPVIGVYGTSWLLVAIGCFVANALGQPRDAGRWVGTAVITSLLLISGLLLQRTEWTSPEGDPVTVAIVQPNVPLKEKWDPRYRNRILSDFSERSTALAQEHALVVWPESALPGYRDRLLEIIEPIDQQFARLDSTLITGIPTRDAARRQPARCALHLLRDCLPGLCAALCGRRSIACDHQ